MPDVTYLIIGGGMAAASAVEGVREVEAAGASIAVISAEPDQPYDRPPLSKGLWKGQAEDEIWRQLNGPGVSLQVGRTIRMLDPGRRQAIDDQGTVYKFRKCLLATGGTPRRLPFGGDHIIYFRTFQDYRRLRRLAEERQRMAVIGGGFIGSEVAAALAMNGKQVTMMFPEEGVGAAVYPPGLSRFLNDYYREKGVEVLPGRSATGLEQRGENLVLGVQDSQGQRHQEILVDGVVAGIGIQPNVELAQQAGLSVENGILVDEQLVTSHPDVYAAGDVAAFENPALARRIRVEHEDNANTMGKQAGRAMAGQPESYHHLPSFYSDLFDLGYEAVGELSSRLETVEDWKEPYQEGVVYYLRDGRVRGVLLWNVWDQVDTARRLIAEPGPFQPEALKGRLPEG